MKILQAYRSGWDLALKLPRLLVLVYLIQLVFAVLITLPLQHILSSSAQRKQSLTKPLAEFDFVLFSEFFNQYRELFWARIDQSLFMMVLFLFFSVFISGGILETIVRSPNPSSAMVFWKSSVTHFGKLFKSLILFGTIQAIILLIFISGIILDGINPFTMESDLAVLRRIQWLLPVFFIPEVIVSMIHDHVKVGIVQFPESTFLQVLRKRIREVLRCFLPATGLYILVLGTVLLIAWAGKGMITLANESTSAGIWTALLISQAFILGRIALKFVNYASIRAFYSGPGQQSDKA